MHQATGIILGAGLKSELAETVQHRVGHCVVVRSAVVGDLLAFKRGLRAARARRARRAFAVRPSSVVVVVVVVAFGCGTRRANRRNNLGFQYVEVLVAAKDLVGPNAVGAFFVFILGHGVIRRGQQRFNRAVFFCGVPVHGGVIRIPVRAVIVEPF